MANRNAMDGTAVNAYLLTTAAGWVGWVESAQGVVRSSLPAPDRAEALRRLDMPEAIELAPAAHPLAARLAAYFAGHPADFADVALALGPATPFQTAVRQVVRAIPLGETMTYGQVAARAGRPGAARAVGQIMARNPVPPFIPCHRVLAAGGGLGGFGGGLPLKAVMLRWEAAI